MVDVGGNFFFVPPYAANLTLSAGSEGSAHAA
jgi:hypothetical protein